MALKLLTTALPDPQTRRETLDWLRSDIERLKGELDDVGSMEDSLMAGKDTYEFSGVPKEPQGLDSEFWDFWIVA